jgi:CBS domain-containing protein
MNIGSICKRHVVTIDAGAPLQEAARRMRDQHVGALVITRDTSEGRRVEGLVTDRDLAVEVLAGETPGSRLQAVGQFTERTLVTATESTGLSQAIDLMRAAGVRRLLVRDEQGRLAGLVSFDDLLQACAEELSGLADVVRKGLQREAAERAEAASRSEMPLLTLHLPAVSAVSPVHAASSAAAGLAAAMGATATPGIGAGWAANGG